MIAGWIKPDFVSEPQILVEQNSFLAKTVLRLPRVWQRRYAVVDVVFGSPVERNQWVCWKIEIAVRLG